MMYGHEPMLVGLSLSVEKWVLKIGVINLKRKNPLKKNEELVGLDIPKKV